MKNKNSILTATLLTLMASSAFSAQPEIYGFPMMDLSKVQPCQNSETVNIRPELQGEYSFTRKSSDWGRRHDALLINSTGLQFAPAFITTKTPLGESPRYMTAQDVNQRGFCLEQKVEQSENHIQLVAEFKNIDSTGLVRSREITKIMVEFNLDNGTATYQSKTSGYTRFLILPLAGYFGKSEKYELTKQ